ncbi:hypothetical protein [Agromyces laixinhei]|uniref:hypothetical protein n=1 Tax=Agromyces laixinhei TaxID=2585717 RepID=UPI00111635C5|nr:hypothetical protein [Agromyces laixinhei]
MPDPDRIELPEPSFSFGHPEEDGSERFKHEKAIPSRFGIVVPLEEDELGAINTGLIRSAALPLLWGNE